MVARTDVSATPVTPEPLVGDAADWVLIGIGSVGLATGGIVSVAEGRGIGVVVTWLLPALFIGAVNSALVLGRFRRLRRRAAAHRSDLAETMLFAQAALTATFRSDSELGPSDLIGQGFLRLGRESLEVWRRDDSEPRETIRRGDVAKVERVQIWGRWGRLLFAPQLRIRLVSGGQLLLAPVSPRPGIRRQNMKHLAELIEARFQGDASGR